MAEGETILDVTQYPDAFQYVNLTLTESNLATADNTALFYADRDVVVDSIILHSTSANDVDDVISIKSVADAANPDNTGDVIATKTGLVQYTKVDMTIDTTKNVVPAGNFIALDLDESTASIDVLFVQIRLRTRRK